MSKEQIKLNDGIDFSKDITDITLSASYIYALEQLMFYFIMELENPADSKPMFEKFEKYVKGEIDIEKEPFTQLESHLYTIFSLQQLFRAKAYSQGLNVKVDQTVDKDLIEELLKATFDGDSEKVKEINAKMQEQLNG